MRSRDSQIEEQYPQEWKRRQENRLRYRFPGIAKMMKLSSRWWIVSGCKRTMSSYSDETCGDTGKCPSCSSSSCDSSDPFVFPWYSGWENSWYWSQEQYSIWTRANCLLYKYKGMYITEQLVEHCLLVKNIPGSFLLSRDQCHSWFLPWTLLITRR